MATTQHVLREETEDVLIQAMTVALGAKLQNEEKVERSNVRSERKRRGETDDRSSLRR